jgi:hypothetical protein
MTFSEDFRFLGPNVAVSCVVEYDRERECYLAVADGGHGGHRGTGHTAKAAALNCFRAWLTDDHAWFEPSE